MLNFHCHHRTPCSAAAGGKSKRKSLKPVKYEELDEEVEQAAAAEDDDEAAMPVDFTMKKKRNCHKQQQQIESPTIDVGTEEQPLVAR